MEIQRIKNEAPKVPELVMQALLSAMESGAIKVGEDLPPERDLAVTLGVGRGSLRECLAILEYLNIIESKGNRKVVAKDVRYFQKAVSFIRVSDEGTTLFESIEFRRAVEIAAAKLACERATEEDFERMERTLDRIDANIYDHEADIEFHENIALASHNVIFVATMALFSSILMDIRIRYYKLPKYHQRTKDSHHQIYQALRARDPKWVEEEIENHLQLVYDFTKEAAELGIIDIDDD